MEGLPPESPATLALVPSGLPDELVEHALATRSTEPTSSEATRALLPLARERARILVLGRSRTATLLSVPAGAWALHLFVADSDAESPPRRLAATRAHVPGPPVLLRPKR